ncbi:MAG: precorrin-4 C(11)-methyltransferase [Bacteroidaceae bacterium]|nr:precorrin-4 C(11)-methyltransferase [Bacteroidaceae bacterium]
MIRIETINDAGKRLAALIEREQIPFDGEAVVFIGALGICVRRMQDLIRDKYTDPAVVCVDTTGRYVIPVLSGHIGGANYLARQIALTTGGEAVVTTQSDNLGLWALDTLAREWGWRMSHLSREAMNRAVALFVKGCPTALIVEWDDAGSRVLKDTCPEHVRLFQSFDEYLAYLQVHPSEFELLLIVSPNAVPRQEVTTIHYYPQCLHLGVGCQRGVPAECAVQLLAELQTNGFAPESVASIATIEMKKDEPMLAALHEALPWADVRIFSADELSRIEIPNPSQKVFEVTGCYGVAEAAAKASGRRASLVVEKQKRSFSLDGEEFHYTYALSKDANRGTTGHIEIVGAGPGDPDLISVRGRKLLEEADLILYAGSLVPRELTACAKRGAVLRSSAGMTLEEQFALMKEFYDRGMQIVRLHTGDPCLYGAIQEQMAFFDRYGMDYHITPGISSFLAAAAELRSQFTIPEKCQTVILTRGEGRTPVPERERLRLLAQHRSTMCIFLSVALARQVQDELLAGGYPPETPVAVCHKLTWREQRILRGQLCQLAQIVEENDLTLTTMIVVGEAIDNREGLSRLYDGHFTHLYRKADA